MTCFVFSSCCPVQEAPGPIFGCVWKPKLGRITHVYNKELKWILNSDQILTKAVKILEECLFSFMRRRRSYSGFRGDCFCVAAARNRLASYPIYVWQPHQVFFGVKSYQRECPLSLICEQLSWNGLNSFAALRSLGASIFSLCLILLTGICHLSKHFRVLVGFESAN